MTDTDVGVVFLAGRHSASRRHYTPGAGTHNCGLENFSTNYQILGRRIEKNATS